MDVYNYKPTPTFKKFHIDGLDIRPMKIDDKTGEILDPGQNYIRCVMGPVGSGKTVGCVNEIFLQAIRQWKNPKDNTRSSRIAIVRDTYKNLNNTTLETFLQWFPEVSWTKVKWTPPIEMTWDFDLAEDDHVHVDFICIALDSPNAMEDLKSLEISGAFINECVACDSDVVNMLIQRVGRWPGGKEDPEKKTISYLIADTNPPDATNWYAYYKDELKPMGWKFYDQPPAMFYTRDMVTGKYTFYPNVGQKPGIPKAENIENLKEGLGYYTKTAMTADPSYTLVFSCMKYGEVGAGAAVYATYDDATHCSDTPLKFNPGLPLLMGFDFGLTPACVYLQYTPYGQVQALAEDWVEGIGIEQFLDTYVLPRLFKDFRGCPAGMIPICDPSGTKKADTDMSSCIGFLLSRNIPVEQCKTNANIPRQESVRYFLNMNIGGKPGLVIGPNCPMLRKGFQGLYKYKTKRNGSMHVTNEPEKNEYSHCHDALQYVCHRIRFASEYTTTGGLFGLWGKQQDLDVGFEQTSGRASSFIL